MVSGVNLLFATFILFNNLLIDLLYAYLDPRIRYRCSITIGMVIITEASLSFLGFGLPLSVPSWGGLLSREGRRYMQVAPWLAMWPGIFLTGMVYGFNMFVDAVRDLLDPRLRGGAGRFSAPRRKRS